MSDVDEARLVVIHTRKAWERRRASNPEWQNIKIDFAAGRLLLLLQSPSEQSPVHFLNVVRLTRTGDRVRLDASLKMRGQPTGDVIITVYPYALVDAPAAAFAGTRDVRYLLSLGYGESVRGTVVHER